MKIIDVLKKRSTNTKDEVKIDLKLYNLADNLEKKARNHLKRIISILKEFDIHDEKHSEKVLQNIEQLLGFKKINELSSYELFLIHLSSFFHDSAMAPSDWELNTLKLTEGSDKYISDENSIRHDLKRPLKLSNAIQLISNKTEIIYKQFSGEVANWIFTPTSEQKLIEYLAELIVDYQNFRNGFASQLKELSSQKEFDDLNDFIRIDYIRATHHTRVETYIKNLEPIISSSFEQPAWGKKLANDLALICRSHGEDSNYISQFSTNSQYYGSSSTNLQFVATMLRLGDIMHFSFDRAPMELRSALIFKSEYSFQQWAIKNNGVNYSIENGKISYRAYCEAPEIYFKLHQYIDWIEIEIQNYYKLQRQWDSRYLINIQDKIDRTNINNDENNFLPMRGLSFSLNQKKIIELLMGIGLYKDKFACLRELYQNSLDACRCMISQKNLTDSLSKGIIEFNLLKNGENTYLCCLDNGIGMSKDIIEKYLLQVGNSYYKSSDFYKQQAIWEGSFTPTSQFGIGILSSFIIGDKIEITTKVSQGEHISCCIDGPHENFYYKKTPEIEKERIPISGTLVKILLKEEIKDILTDHNIEKLGILLFGGEKNHLPKSLASYIPFYDNWENSLYNHIDKFVQIIPDNISVNIILDKNRNTQILQKPTVLDINNKELDINEADLECLDFLSNRWMDDKKPRYSEIRESLETYVVNIHHHSVEFKTVIILPKENYDFDRIKSIYSIPRLSNYGLCIDGISVGTHNSIKHENFYSRSLIDKGILNFYGELRPQLSIDRKSIVNYPDKCEEISKEITELFLRDILDKAKYHISKYNFIEDDKLNVIWDYIFETVGFADIIFISKLSLTQYGNIVWNKLCNVINEELSIYDFLSKENILIKHFNISKLDILTQKIILTKLYSCNTIKVKGNSVLFESTKSLNTELIRTRNSFADDEILICADEWTGEFEDYDIVSNLYPVVPKKLFNLLDTFYVKNVNQNIKKVHAYGNGIVAFFQQDPKLINKNLGLYTQDIGLSKRKNNLLYNFQNKRSNIPLFEINERETVRSKKEVYVVVVFISPHDLNEEEKIQLSNFKEKDSSYIKGVTKGWSILATGMDDENVVILPGKSTKQELVANLTESFWDTYHDYTFKYTDGTVMKR